MKECIECGMLCKLFSKGRCRYCAAKSYKKPSTTKKPKENKMELDNYFIDRLIDLNKTRSSEESGKKIAYPSRMNVCHLYAKTNHPSVADHPQNYVFLTVDEHSKLDGKCLIVNDFEELKTRFPNSFEKIMERMRIIRPDVQEKTKFTEAFDRWEKLTKI